MTPSGTLEVDVFPNADFAGLYDYEKPSDSTCPKIRTGFLISLSDFLVLWISKLQRETALSTMEAEINSLAHCCLELFPVMDMVGEIGRVAELPIAY